ncbi:cation transporter [Melioribacteraceae bacterium 4301-Me]|uniref:cation transporter n=1 Tax=Pyranulibacter aquaticus TaxID=3163344 RepID=UPI003597866D
MLFTQSISDESRAKLYSYAYALMLITIYYNIVEGLISVIFGYEDGTLSLLGFGIDSFVEVISGIGIWHFLKRIKQKGEETRDDFEKTALKVTGTAFYFLSAGLAATAIYNVVTNHKPETTFWGIVISIISILAMQLLIMYKMKVGKALNSQAIIADAKCTKTCLYLSIILLLASLGYELTNIGGIDSIGAVLIAYLSYKEGKESFEKARTNKLCSCEDE